jgi:hypothetical protein
MSKTTKVQRKALGAIDDAEAAAKRARKVAKSLPGKSAKKLREVAAETVDDVDVSKKAVMKNPAKIAKKAQLAEQRMREATRVAIAKLEKKARARAKAQRAAAASARAAEIAEARAAESKQQEKPTADAGRTAAGAEKEVVEADRQLEAALAPEEVGTDAAPAAPPRARGRRSTPAAAPATVTPAARTRTTRAKKAPGAAELEALTVVQLRERARTAGRTGYSRLTKSELIALLS